MLHQNEWWMRVVYLHRVCTEFKLVKLYTGTAHTQQHIDEIERKKEVIFCFVNRLPPIAFYVVIKYKLKLFGLIKA